GGKVLRRGVDDVKTEVAAAAKAERKAAREAQLELMRAKRDQTRESGRATVEELKAKLSHRNGERATKLTAGATS
ncbi:MAG TPA: hypothetical protein VI300_14460, partial [Solirubrobacter sp.]